mmetsp:Transcript_115854/g.359943  ORF Transcript_115854/g.359943 Transcript_115854/m.359943 type:complete len:124 (-) Transcript_115854:63-434(-)
MAAQASVLHRRLVQKAPDPIRALPHGRVVYVDELDDGYWKQFEDSSEQTVPVCSWCAVMDIHFDDSEETDDSAPKASSGGALPSTSVGSESKPTGARPSNSEQNASCTTPPSPSHEAKSTVSL